MKNRDREGEKERGGGEKKSHNLDASLWADERLKKKKKKKVGGGGKGGTCYGSTKRQEFNKNIQLNCNVTYNEQAKRVMKKALEKTP